MEAYILQKAIAGSFGVTVPEEVEAVRRALAKGWVEALVCTASSHSPMEGAYTALVLSLTAEGRMRLEAIRQATSVHAH